MCLTRRLIAVFAALSACSVPTVVLRVDHRAGATRVELRRVEKRLVEREDAIAVDECAFYRVEEESKGGEEIWRVVTLGSENQVTELRYGTVPPGFAQVTPPGGPPPPLRRGVRYRAECHGETSALRAATDFRIPERTKRRAPRLHRR